MIVTLIAMFVSSLDFININITLVDIVMMFMTQCDDIIYTCRSAKLMVYDMMPLHMVSRTANLASVPISFPSFSLRSYMR